ncbi:DNA-binding transcriptional regulator YbjK [Nocardiopsis mwathae]|uniref:DNA-binding transcriptional regulator YbjK n=1 Tax=Nocardiopsis mwathae TaxID=1472723 RepID=A0A7W9YI61_9ACTN|nr:DNA-binding transcriptional regulator YbjK [Nocardiopsis mwathae]
MTRGRTAAGPTDGRRVRGQRRRSEIIAATLRVVERDGVAGVTHRAVAREAGVPASSALYYFATLDDLLVAALTEAADGYVHRMRELVGAGQDALDGLAAMVTESAEPAGRIRSLAEYELTLLAVRRPALRPVARKWIDLVAEVAAGYTDDPVAIRAAVAVADGLCIEALLEDRALEPGEVRAVLRHVLRLT